MTVIEDLQAVLIDALLRDATQAQVDRALAELVRVVGGPAFVIGDNEDEVAAAWLVNALARLRAVR
jgi:sensor domain CHASE-containing protein